MQNQTKRSTKMKTNQGLSTATRVPSGCPRRPVDPKGWIRNPEESERTRAIGKPNLAPVHRMAIIISNEISKIKVWIKEQDGWKIRRMKKQQQ